MCDVSILPNLPKSLQIPGRIPDMPNHLPEVQHQIEDEPQPGPTLLFLDDNAEIYELLHKMLGLVSGSGDLNPSISSIAGVRTREEFDQHISNNGYPDMLLLNISFDGDQEAGIHLAKHVDQENPNTAVIFLSAAN